jgi:hypothetical protein
MPDVPRVGWYAKGKHMHEGNRPAYWHLDLFVLVMACLLFVVGNTPLFRLWEIVVESVWCVVLLAGMTLWLWLNWTALQHADQRATPRCAMPEQPPLTPVQRRFRAVMRWRNRN